MKKKKKNHLYINKTFQLQHQRFGIIAIRYIFILNVFIRSFAAKHNYTIFVFSITLLTADL